MNLLTFARGFQYVERAYFAALSYKVAKDICDQLAKLGDDGFSEFDDLRPGRRYHNFLSMQKDSIYDGIIYSALAAESFINHIGHLVYQKRYYEERIERERTKKKWKDITVEAIGISLDGSAEPLKSILRLSAERDNLVHDKPLTVKSHVEIAQARARQQVWLLPPDAFKILVIIDDLYRDFRYQGTQIRLIDPFFSSLWNELCSGKEYTVCSGLPFALGKFPSVLQYQIFLRNRTGDTIVGLQLDEALMLITRQ